MYYRSLGRNSQEFSFLQGLVYNSWMDFSFEKTLFKPIAVLAIIGIFIWFVISILGWIERNYLKSSYFPYSRKKQFLSAAERNFYDALIKAVGPEFMVFAKCRVVDLLEVDFQKHFRAFNRIKSRKVDFVVVRKGDDSLVCAIELSDKLHERFDKESLFLDEAFSLAGLPLIRIETQEVYSIVELQKALVLSVWIG